MVTHTRTIAKIFHFQFDFQTDNISVLCKHLKQKFQVNRIKLTLKMPRIVMRIRIYVLASYICRMCSTTYRKFNLELNQKIPCTSCRSMNYPYSQVIYQTIHCANSNFFEFVIKRTYVSIVRGK